LFNFNNEFWFEVKYTKKKQKGNKLGIARGGGDTSEEQTK